MGQYVPPGQETALSTTDTVKLIEGAGMFPVAEAKTIVVWTTAKIKHDAQYDESGNSDDFNRRENKFAFTIGAWSGEK